MDELSHFHHPRVAHGHSHAHSHGHHTHAHRPEERKCLFLCILLTGTMMIGEAVGGWLTNSLALLSDAGHMLTHFLALVISYLAIGFAARPPTQFATYGYYRVEILAALLNAVTLVAISVWIIVAAAGRLATPEPVQSVQMSVVAVIGFVVNLSTAYILHGVSQDDMNVKGAYLHMLGDTISSVAVIAGGIAMAVWHWYLLDPLLSILICVVILYWAYGLTRDAVRVLMEATPKHIQLDAVTALLKQRLPGVLDVHDLHVWEITSGMYALTAHVRVANCSVAETMALRGQAEQLLDETFRISHTILQFEC